MHQRAIKLVAIAAVAGLTTLAEAGDVSRPDEMPRVSDQTAIASPSQGESNGISAPLLSEPPTTGLAEALAPPTARDLSPGQKWDSIARSGAVPLVSNRSWLDAKVDPEADNGKVGASVSGTVALGGSASVTLQESYAMTQSPNAGLSGLQPVVPEASTAGIMVPGWGVDRSLRFNLSPSGTTFSAGVTTSSTDSQWHNKLSAEQKLFGPLSVTTSVTDPGTAASNKSITAGFKHTW